MPCSVIKVGDTFMFVKHARTRSKRCEFCQNSATRQCDFVMSKTLDGREITCDAFICSSCSRPGGDEIDFCPRHR